MNRSTCASGRGYVPLLLDGVLRGEHQEYILQRVGRAGDGHLALLHRLQQRALHLRGGTIHLVGEHEIGEDRPLVDAKLGGARVVYLGADQVRGQQVRSELEAGETGVDGL